MLAICARRSAACRAGSAPSSGSRRRATDRAIVEPGAGLLDVAQGRHLEELTVRFVLRDLEAPRVVRRIRLDEPELRNIRPPIVGPMWRAVQPVSRKVSSPATSVLVSASSLPSRNASKRSEVTSRRSKAPIARAKCVVVDGILLARKGRREQRRVARDRADHGDHRRRALASPSRSDSAPVPSPAPRRRARAHPRTARSGTPRCRRSGELRAPRWPRWPGEVGSPSTPEVARPWQLLQEISCAFEKRVS